jgi:NAD(P)-dependent dehydrogenase (short-subunit alcohol dehydrogenase family)
MGIYAVTGGTKGIGEQAIAVLKRYGHQTINIDIDGGDIHVDLGKPEGRAHAIERLHELCPDGLDGLVSNAGIAVGRKPSDVLSVNYFGAVALAEGVYDLLKLKKGNCAVTVSGSIAYSQRGKYYVDELLTNCGDEERICRFVNSLDPMKLGGVLYVSTKMALVRWVRRTAPSWAVQGVNLNAMAPGAVNTTIMPGTAVMDGFDTFILGRAMPTVYHQKTLMETPENGEALAFLVMPGAKGCCGAVLYCDGGTSAFLHSEKVY